MVWFRETWYEEVLRQLKQGLTKCYVVAFENRAAGEETTPRSKALCYSNHRYGDIVVLHRQHHPMIVLSGYMYLLLYI